MRPRTPTTKRKGDALSDALAAALLEGPGTAPPTGASAHEVDDAWAEVYDTGHHALWTRFGDAARQKARAWGWEPTLALDGTPVFWGEYFWRRHEQYRR